MDFDRLRRNWENLGKRDPMWAVLTQAGTEGGRWDEAAFYRTGVEFVDWLGSWLGLKEIPVPKGPALDFGCGVGRLTQALAPHFQSVTGVDVSDSMIEFANAHNQHGERVRYVCNTRPDLSLFADASFEFALSVIVLQHMRSDYALGYIGEMLRVLQPGGLLFFQIPTSEREPTSGNAPDTEPPDEARMEMHCTAREQLLVTIDAGGGDVLCEEPNLWAGDAYHSLHLAVRRR